MGCDSCSNEAKIEWRDCVANVEHMAAGNPHFRVAVWTGKYLQMTLMYIPPCGNIGVEMHPETDQMIRIEQGKAVVQMGSCKGKWEFQHQLVKGDVVFIPAGTWHNILNAAKVPLRVSSTYAPPNHPSGTLQHTKADAEEY